MNRETLFNYAKNIFIQNLIIFGKIYLIMQYCAIIRMVINGMLLL